MGKNKHLAVIYQNKDLPFIFEEAHNMGVRVTFFYDINNDQPENLPSVTKYIGVDIFKNTQRAIEVIKSAFQDDPFDGVITLFDPALSFVANIARELNLHYLSTETINNCRGKDKTRKILQKNGLNTPVFYEVYSQKDIAKYEFDFPLVVKPSNGFSSQGVIRVNNLRELYEAVNNVKEINSKNLKKITYEETKILIEQFIDGPEFAVESFSVEGQVHILSIGYKGDPKGPYFEEGVYIAPAQLDKKIREEIAQEVKKAIIALGIENGPSHTELRLHRGKKPYVIEVGARVGGSGISHYIVKESTNVNYLKLAIKNSFKVLEQSEIPPIINNSRTVGNYIIGIQGSGVFEEILGLERLKNIVEVKRIIQLIRKGNKVLPYPYFSGYPGFILTSHKSYEECESFYRMLDQDIRIKFNKVTSAGG